MLIPEGLWMENYHEVEIKPITPPMLSEAPTSRGGILGPVTTPFLAGKGRRDLQPWAGTRTRDGGTMRDMPTTSREARDVVKRMTPGGELATKRGGTADHRGLRKTSNRGGPPTRSLLSSRSR